jgi:hypothetical protein
MNYASSDCSVTTANRVRDHVFRMLVRLQSKLRGANTLVDYTVEVDRKKNRSGGIDGV